MRACVISEWPRLKTEVFEWEWTLFFFVLVLVRKPPFRIGSSGPPVLNGSKVFHHVLPDGRCKD